MMCSTTVCLTEAGDFAGVWFCSSSETRVNVRAEADRRLLHDFRAIPAWSQLRLRACVVGGRIADPVTIRREHEHDFAAMATALWRCVVDRSRRLSFGDWSTGMQRHVLVARLSTGVTCDFDANEVASCSARRAHSRASSVA